MTATCDVSVVVLTYNRCAEVVRCVRHLLALPEAPPVIVVDNGSIDGTPAVLAAEFPTITVIRAPANLGAAGRNLGVARVTTRYVAFSDDDTWWEAGSLRHAAQLLDAHPAIAVLAARVLVGAEERLDPSCAEMAASPLRKPGLPGPLLIGFMAGAAVMRVDAYRVAGGYARELFIGGEEALLALDLATRGWHIVYAGAIVTHHHPSPARNRPLRDLLMLRNRLCIAWLRLPLHQACSVTRDVWREAARRKLVGPLARAVVSRLPWVVRQRRVVSAEVTLRHAQVRHRGRQRAHRPATFDAALHDGKPRPR